MKKTKYLIEVRQDYENNNGAQQWSESEVVDTIEQATELWDEWFGDGSIGENGLSGECVIKAANFESEEELQEIEDYPGLIDHIYTNGYVVKEETFVPVTLDEKAVIVYYQHITYMGYAYKITGCEYVGHGKTSEDLPYSDERTYSTWAVVFDSISELEQAWVNSWG